MVLVFVPDLLLVLLLDTREGSTLCVGMEVLDAVGDTEALGMAGCAVRVPVMEADAEPLREAVDEADGEAVRDGEPVGLDVREGESVGDAERLGEGVEEELRELVGVGVAERELVCVGECVREALGVAVGELVTELLPLPEPVGVWEAEPLSVLVPDGVPVPVGVLLKVAAAERDAEEVDGGVPTREADEVPVGVGGRVEEGVPVCVEGDVLDSVAALELDGMEERLPVGEGVLVDEGAPEDEGVPDGARESEGVLETVCDLLGVLWSLPAVEALGRALGDAGRGRTALKSVPRSAEVRKAQELSILSKHTSQDVPPGALLVVVA